MSYRKKHIKSRIHKIKPKKSILKRPVFWILILIIFIFSAAVYFTLFYSGLWVRNIVITGNSKANTQDIKNLVLSTINKKIIAFGPFNVSSDSILLANTSDINEKILKKFPIIEKTTINKNLPQTLSLDITERKPLGVFCDSDQNTTKNCFLIDDNGVIFEPSPVILSDAIIVRQLSGNGQIFAGAEVVNKNVMSLIAKVSKDLKDNFQIDLKEAFITGPLRMDVKTSENWQIYFNLDPAFGIDLQLAKLNLLLNGQIAPEVRKNLQYIDLRFKDRAYYK